MELAKAYEPRLVEEKWYKEWLRAGAFKAVPDEREPYCITIPPPNITGSLHMGHALNNTVIDTMTRWHRMRGFNTLTVPGTDHAGIATQNVVEKQLAKEGKTRHDIGREAFIERCWEWRGEYGDRIYQQFYKLGCSYDWDRARFTMDESYVDAIYEEFLRWWERGLIYRGARVVNWCPRCMSAISDIEVNSEERAGKLYHFRYPFAPQPPITGESDSPVIGGWGADTAYITIATTRPETLLGDTAVAVNPADERYRGQIGKMLRLPLTDREIPLITDEYAKMEFGTGAVKVTPAHDLNDFEAGLRNNLPQVVVIGEDGKMTEAAGPDFAGLDRFEARKKVLAEMESLGLLEKIEDYTIQLPLCDRCNTVIEPLLSEQWFAKQQELAAPAIEAVKDGRIRFIPERYTRIYLEWMEKIQPWCISRQLWWGHRIPVWWTEDGQFTAARSLEDASEKLGLPPEDLRQDEDVLDTWFSSALWPHATLGWPRETEDLKFWYPTNLLSTAQEIIFLWVARMIMTGIDFMGEIPFRDVYIHATVLDEKGERMSKSKGNGVDPLDMVERYGADAMRFYLLQHAGMNQDIKFREDEVKLAGQFCNKLWNASRFVLMNLEDADPVLLRLGPQESETTRIDKWILNRLDHTIQAVNSNLASYNMDDAARAVYSFVWDEFCDWYLELAKLRLSEEGSARATVQAVMYHVLSTVVRLIHPMMPFITEEIYSALVSVTEKSEENPQAGQSLSSMMPAHLSSLPYPSAEPPAFTRATISSIGLVFAAVQTLRRLKADARLAPSSKPVAVIVPNYHEQGRLFSDHADVIAYLARLSDVQLHDSPPVGGQWVSSPVTGGEVFLETGAALDIPKELERIAKDLERTEKELAGVQGRLGNAQFVERAAPEVVEKARAQAAELIEKREKLIERRSALAKG